MLLSLNEQANSRKLRLAKLREERKLEKEPAGDVQTQSIFDHKSILQMKTTYLIQIAAL